MLANALQRSRNKFSILIFRICDSSEQFIIKTIIKMYSSVFAYLIAVLVVFLQFAKL